MASISRTDVAALIQDAYSDTFLESANGTSKVLQAFPTVNMGTKTYRLPVMATVPHAKWVGESATDASGVKPTGKATWGNKELIAEEVAIIVPIHENAIADATTDVVGDIARAGGQAIAYALDAAVIAGINKPTTWLSPDLFKSATDAGAVFQVGTGSEDLAGQILNAAGEVADEFDPSDIFARSGLRYKLANIRNADGTPIFAAALSNAPDARDSVQGLQAHWVKGNVDDGSGGDQPIWDASEALALVVDASRVRIGVRQDITVKYLDQATVGGINLAERDHVAFRFVARYAYVLGNNVLTGTTASTHSPTALVTPGLGS